MSFAAVKQDCAVDCQSADISHLQVASKRKGFCQHAAAEPGGYLGAQRSLHSVVRGRVPSDILKVSPGADAGRQCTPTRVVPIEASPPLVDKVPLRTYLRFGSLQA